MPNHTEADDISAAAKRGLVKPIQEHLGQHLRAVYTQIADKPTYLGDPALPSEFEHQLVRLETSLEVRESAVAAVKDALEDAATHEKAVEAVKDALGIASSELQPSDES